MGTRNSQTQPLAGGLYIVATPIGNLADITYRAVDVLKSADLIACEDTRVSATLLNHYGIKRPLVAYHDHNADKARPKLMQALSEGKIVALISDAGTPLISDPGYKLVNDARERGLNIWPIPGASSITAALSACGLPTDHFFFAGFLPAKVTACKKALTDYLHIDATLVFLESPQRLTDTLSILADIADGRTVSVARELTKRFEEIRSGSAAELLSHYDSTPPKGEIVLLISPPETVVTREQSEVERTLSLALEYLSVKDASALVSTLTGTKKADLYKRALELAKHGKS